MRKIPVIMRSEKVAGFLELTDEAHELFGRLSFEDGAELRIAFDAVRHQTTGEICLLRAAVVGVNTNLPPSV